MMPVLECYARKSMQLKYQRKATLVATNYTGASSSIHSLTASYCYGLIHTTLDSSSAWLPCCLLNLLLHQASRRSQSDMGKTEARFGRLAFHLPGTS